MSKAIEKTLRAWAGYPEPSAPVQDFGPRYFDDEPSRQDQYLTVELTIIRLGIEVSKGYIRLKTLNWVAFDKPHDSNYWLLREALGKAA